MGLQHYIEEDLAVGVEGWAAWGIYELEEMLARDARFHQFIHDLQTDGDE